MGEERRFQPRRKIFVSCQVECGDRLASGRIVDASFNGLAVLLPEAGDLVKGESRIHVPPARQTSDDPPEAIVLLARPVNMQQKTKGHRLGFKISTVESGASEWTRLCREFHGTPPV